MMRASTYRDEQFFLDIAEISDIPAGTMRLISLPLSLSGY